MKNKINDIYEEAIGIDNLTECDSIEFEYRRLEEDRNLTVGLGLGLGTSTSTLGTIVTEQLGLRNFSHVVSCRF